ncbi:hypothetical protein VTL71DRAFT_7504 [Oculimacula yallundae]|uniref:Uncharacterized protein n=1 Tax=Oculimacula yallundae TaxID=86028 RepID=A0ABR4BVU6_9HELO
MLQERSTLTLLLKRGCVSVYQIVQHIRNTPILLQYSFRRLPADETTMAKSMSNFRAWRLGIPSPTPTITHFFGFFPRFLPDLFLARGKAYYRIPAVG